MKNNLILGLQGFTKVLTGTIVVIALIATNFTHTYVSGSKAKTTGAMQRRSVPAARGGRAAKGQAGSSTSTSSAAGAGQTPTTTAQATPATLAEKVDWVLEQDVPWSAEANAVLADIYPKISLAQQKKITNYYNSKMELQRLKQQLAQLQQHQTTAAVIKPIEQAEGKKREEKGYFASLFDYESYLSRFMPKEQLSTGQAMLAGVAGTALAGTVGAASMGLLGTTAAAYISVTGALKFMGAGFAFDRLTSAVRRKERTFSAGVEAAKDILEQIVAGDNATYPTYALKVQVLETKKGLPASVTENELFGPASERLIYDLKQTAANVFQKYPKEREREQKINAAVTRYRTEYGAGVSIPEYVTKLEQLGNIEESQAYVSEYVLNRNILAIAAAQTAAQRQAAQAAEAQAQKAVEEAEKSTAAAKAAAGQPGAAPAEEEESSWFRLG